MTNPAFGNQVKMLFIGAVALMLAVFLGWLIGTEDYKPLILGTLGIIGACIWFFTGRFFWVLAVASSFLGGTFPILGGSFTPFQILMAMGVIKFVVEDLILRRVVQFVFERFDLILIAGFMGVLTWHGVNDRFGMRFLGSNVWGGRNYVNVYVGLAAFFVIQSIPMKAKLWNKLPYLILAVTGFDLAIALLTNFYPASVYRIYPFYSAVSTGNLDESTGMYDQTGRIGAYGNFGGILILLVFAAISLRQLFHPSNFFRLVALALGALGVLYSGFRTAVINALLTALAAGTRDLRFGMLALLPLLAALLFGLSLFHSQIMPLPRQIQRGLAFIPGDWDAAMALDAKASNDFRGQVWGLWTRQYFPEHPLIGRGFGFKSQYAAALRYRAGIDYQQMVEVGNIHNGLLATVDAVGIVGTLFFAAWNLRLLLRTFRVSFSANNPAAFALRFLALYLGVSIVFYWFGATTIGSFLPREFALAAVFLKLQSSPELNLSRPITPSPTGSFSRSGAPVTV